MNKGDSGENEGIQRVYFQNHVFWRKHILLANISQELIGLPGNCGWYTIKNKFYRKVLADKSIKFSRVEPSKLIPSSLHGKKQPLEANLVLQAQEYSL